MSTITLRLSEIDEEALKFLKEHTGEKTASKAILHAIHNFASTERNLQSETELHNDSKDSYERLEKRINRYFGAMDNLRDSSNYETWKDLPEWMQ